MIDYLKQITSYLNPEEKKNIAREYLQARILQRLQEQGFFQKMAFMGGTSLRFLYGIPRFSEDLDFSVIDSKEGLPEFKKTLHLIKNRFERENYEISIKLKQTTNVWSAFFGFSGILYELGASPHNAQKLSIKIEIDTCPPKGAGIENTLVTRHVLLNLTHHDFASLFAGKIHALLTRKYTKGRDVYDLFWYLGQRQCPEPNFEFLGNALKQSNWKKEKLTASNWKSQLLEHLATLNWQAIQKDIRPFLENDREVEILQYDNLKKLLT